MDTFVEIPGEKWVDFHGYPISNRGRVQTKRGVITTGTQMKYQRNDQYTTIYSIVELTIKNKSRHFYMHRLVWTAFNGPIPEGMFVLHNDSNPLTRDENNVQRNWLCDLRLGTQSENMQEYNDNKPDNKKSVLGVLTGNFFECRF